MSTLSENDYKALKSYTLEQLTKYREELQDKLFLISASIDTLTGDAHTAASEEMDDLIIWINAYSTEITKRCSITTPPLKPSCYGCEQGYLNQMGHYGGCIPDPDQPSLDLE